MTGPDHFAEAQRLLEMVQTVPQDQLVPTVTIKDDQRSANIIAAAQVHATLAQTAATIDATRINPEGWANVLNNDND